ncbi:Sulfopyruvate decarboxylase, TPP-binding subunit (coenzyme M biosynthesis) [Variovorax sp. CF079]|uniref:phosphonopyruvate decarboxylase n=1 Tax=Variovorax sp. CF079 TaxID=1882774 RepID=UPI00087DFF17|nr:phosphonopyruvate decarboxylase [Variovorax sp. CF079]SDE93684.1 Sulfopyruvate decarboxylase, TPP-binding subunit (coenzyme M biosynthesis) [Variovorax sp. CF079]
MATDVDQTVRPWQKDIHAAFKAADVRHISYVPDGGHRGLINLCAQDPEIGTTVLVTEEEGVALSTGLWLGQTKSALLMQSSGVGNCLNLFTLAENCRIPLVLLVTMRGEFAEYIPWQIPMGKRAGAALELMGFDVYRAEAADSVGEICAGAIDQAFFSKRCVAVLLSQRLIGRKNWAK